MNQLLIAFTLVACLFVSAQSASIGRDFQERLGKMENQLNGFLTRSEFNAKVKDFEDAIHLLIMADDRLKSYWKESTQQIAHLERMLQSSDSQASAKNDKTGFYDVKDPQSLELQLKASNEKIEQLEQQIRKLDAKLEQPVTKDVENK